MQQEPVTIFYSYAHADEHLKGELLKHLSVLERDGIVKGWHDRLIQPGMNWEEEINTALNTSEVILLLISSDFNASKYCSGIELKTAIERQDSGEAICVPIFMRECSFVNTPYAKLQGIPRDAKFITDTTTWPNIDKPLTLVAKELGDLIRKFQSEKSKKKDSILIIEDKGKESVSNSDEDLLAAIKILKDKKKNLGYNSTPEEITEYRTLYGKIMEDLNPQELIDNIPKLSENYPVELFNSIYGQEKLTKPAIEEINNIRNNSAYKWYHRSLIVSALTISLLDHKKVDQQKIILLIDFVNDAEEFVWEKALLGLVIGLTCRPNAWIKYDEVIRRLKSLRERKNIQDSLHLISYMVEMNLCNTFLIDKSIYESTFLKNQIANCFIPFYDDNPAIKNFLEDSQEVDAGDYIDFLKKLPFPAIVKYACCHNRDNQEKEGKPEFDESMKETLKYFIKTSLFFQPFLQYLAELYGFYNHYPSTNREKIFNNQLSLSNSKLKDLVFSEIEKFRLLSLNFMKKEDWGNAIVNLKHVLSLAGEDTEALHNICICMANLNKRQEELEYRYKIEKISNEDVKNLISIADILYRNNNNKNSILYYEKALALDTNCGECYTGIASNYFDLGYYEEALDFCQKAIGIGYVNFYNYYIASLAYKSMNKSNEALEYINRAIEIKNDDADLIVEKGYVLYLLGKQKEAMAVLDEALEVDKNNEPYYLYKSVVLCGNGDFETAMNVINKGISIDLTSYSIYRQKGSIFDDMGKYEEALLYFDKSLGIKPNLNPQAHNAKAITYCKLNLFDKALEEIEMAIKELNDNGFNAFGELYGTKALIFAFMGDDENFYKYIDIALARYADINSLEDSIKNRYRNDRRFNLILERYNQVLK